MIEGDVLKLTVDATQVSFVEIERETLAGYALKAFGRKLKIVVTAEAGPEATGTAPVAASPKAPKKEPPPRATSDATAKPPSKTALKARSKAAVDPVVNRTLDMFGGSLLDVRPLESDAEPSEGDSPEES